MKRTVNLLLLIFPIFCIGQTQIGADINGEAANNSSGQSVSISSDGTHVAIGAPYNNGSGTNSGHVRVYQNVSGIWTQVGADINGEAAGDQSHIVALSANGSTVAIGAPYNNGSDTNSGHVRVFQNVSGVWTQIGADLNGDSVGSNFGSSVSISDDGSIVAAGSFNNGGIGYVKVYKNISGVWTQIGNNIVGVENGDFFSKVSLSSDGNSIAIGASSYDGNGANSGLVRVYQNVSGVWTQIGNNIIGEAAGDSFGRSISLSADGSIVAIGAPLYGGINFGRVQVYQNIAGVWTQIGDNIDGEINCSTGSTEFGGSVSLSDNGNILAIGGHGNCGNGIESGHVRIYQNISGVWTQIGVDIDGEAAYDYSGISVSLSSDGSVLAIGAPSNDGNGNSSGHVRVYNLIAILSADDFTLNELKTYPNPTNDILNFSFDKEISKVTIYNLVGQEVLSKSFNNNETSINVTGLSAGTYLVKVNSKNAINTIKFIKQ